MAQELEGPRDNMEDSSHTNSLCSLDQCPMRGSNPHTQQQQGSRALYHHQVVSQAQRSSLREWH